ncbi:hypothetical protein [Streptomyces noursei]|uniref:hypothetical protein n=1 Tax=Streptomyces noursei TaxID=1971 RepID=UPI0037F270D3
MISPTLRAVVIGGSLKEGSLPAAFASMEDRRYPSRLGEQTEIEIIELTVPTQQVAAMALELSAALKPRFFYAHLLDKQRMLVVFPRTVVEIPRGDAGAVSHASSVGSLFRIPVEQMRFAEM